jgi:outer membrane receptor for ferrienterochelin and colicin
VTADGYQVRHTEAITAMGEPVSVDMVLQAAYHEELVVTATRTERRLTEVPVRTEAVRREEIERVEARTLADAVEFTTGVRVEANCQNCNFSQIRLLGLEGAYTQILIDSQPTISSLAQVYGVEQIPARMIDRIEVVKGGGSALYGAGMDPNAYGTTENPLLVFDSQVNYRLGSHYLSAGIQYQQDELIDTQPAYDRYIEDTYTNLGVYLQDDWMLGRGWELIYGARFDSYSEIENDVVSPRVAVKYAARPDLTARLLVSSGFRGPHVFDEDRLEVTDDFLTLDVRLAREFFISGNGSTRFRAAIGGCNITDEFQQDLDQGPDRDSGYVYGPRFPRSWYVSAGLIF